MNIDINVSSDLTTLAVVTVASAGGFWHRVRRWWKRRRKGKSPRSPMS